MVLVLMGIRIRSHERRGHVAAMYFMSGASLYFERCVQRPFLGFVRVDVPGDSRSVRSDGSVLGDSQPKTSAAQRDGLSSWGLVNAFGNLRWFCRAFFTSSGWLKKEYQQHRNSI